MEEKVFKTLDELVDILKQRGIDIPDSSARDYAKRVLEKNGYYNLTYCATSNRLRENL